MTSSVADCRVARGHVGLSDQGRPAGARRYVPAAGHRVQAAATMGQLRSALSAYLHEGPILARR